MYASRVSEKITVMYAPSAGYAHQSVIWNHWPRNGTAISIVLLYHFPIRSTDGSQIPLARCSPSLIASVPDDNEVRSIGRRLPIARRI